MGKLSNDKGKVFERRIARMFREQLGIDVKRGWQSRKGMDAPDVCVPGLWIECKHGKQTRPKAALAQAMSDAKAGYLPVAITRNDGAPILVTMLFSDWLDLCGGEIAALGDLDKT